MNPQFLRSLLSILEPVNHLESLTEFINTKPSGKTALFINRSINITAQFLIVLNISVTISIETE